MRYGNIDGSSGVPHAGLHFVRRPNVHDEFFSGPAQRRAGADFHVRLRFHSGAAANPLPGGRGMLRWSSMSNDVAIMKEPGFWLAVAAGIVPIIGLGAALLWVQ